MGMGFAAVTCSRNWTPMCDAIQGRMDAVMPYMLALLALLVAAVIVLAIREIRRSLRTHSPRAAEELRHRLGPDAE